jgi:hypothetical protein
VGGFESLPYARMALAVRFHCPYSPFPSCRSCSALWVQCPWALTAAGYAPLGVFLKFFSADSHLECKKFFNRTPRFQVKEPRGMKEGLQSPPTRRDPSGNQCFICIRKDFQNLRLRVPRSKISVRGFLFRKCGVKWRRERLFDEIQG